MKSLGPWLHSQSQDHPVLLAGPDPKLKQVLLRQLRDYYRVNENSNVTLLYIPIRKRVVDGIPMEMVLESLDRLLLDEIDKQEAIADSSQESSRSKSNTRTTKTESNITSSYWRSSRTSFSDSRSADSRVSSSTLDKSEYTSTRTSNSSKKSTSSFCSDYSESVSASLHHEESSNSSVSGLTSRTTSSSLSSISRHHSSSLNSEESSVLVSTTKSRSQTSISTDDSEIQSIESEISTTRSSMASISESKSSGHREQDSESFSSSSIESNEILSLSSDDSSVTITQERTRDSASTQDSQVSPSTSSPSSANNHSKTSIASSTEATQSSQNESKSGSYEPENCSHETSNNTHSITNSTSYLKSESSKTRTKSESATSNTSTSVSCNPSTAPSETFKGSKWDPYSPLSHSLSNRSTVSGSPQPSITSTEQDLLQRINDSLETLVKLFNQRLIIVVPVAWFFVGRGRLEPRVRRRWGAGVQLLVQVLKSKGVTGIFVTEPFEVTPLLELPKPTPKIPPSTKKSKLKQPVEPPLPQEWEYIITVTPRTSPTPNTPDFITCLHNETLFGDDTSLQGKTRLLTFKTAQTPLQIYTITQTLLPPPKPIPVTIYKWGEEDKDMDPGYIYTSLRHTSREKVPVSVLLRHLAKSPVSSQVSPSEAKTFPKFMYATVVDSLATALSGKQRKGVGKVDVEEAVVNRELWYKLAHTVVSTRSNVMERRGSGQVLVLLLTWFRLPRREFLGFVRKELGKGWLYDAVMASLQVAFTIKLVRWQTQLEKEVLKEKIGLLVAAAGLMSVFGEFVRRVDDERRGIWIRGISRGIRECYKVAIGCVEVDGGVPDEISTACMGLLASLPFLIRPGDTEGMNDVDWDTVEEIACQYPCWQTRDMAHHTMRKLDVVLRKAGINTNRVAASWKQACVRKQMHPCMVSVVVE